MSSLSLQTITNGQSNYKCSKSIQKYFGTDSSQLSNKYSSEPTIEN